MLRQLQALAYFCIGEIHLRRGKFGDAEAWMSKVIWLYPNRHFAYVDRGVALQGLGEHSRAIDDFDRAIDLAPRFAMTYSNRGISWKLLGNHDRAIADHTRAIQLAPKWAVAYGELGTTYGFKRDFDRSIANLTTAIKLAPKDPTYLRQRGYVQFCRGDFEAAAADLHNALNLADDTYAVLFHYLARARTTGAAFNDLNRNAKRVKNGKWPAPMIGLYLGTLDVNSALAAASNFDERGEAQFFLGQWHLLHNDRAEAIKALQAAACSCPTWFVEHAAAIAELARLQ